MKRVGEYWRVLENIGQCWIITFKETMSRDEISGMYFVVLFLCNFLINLIFKLFLKVSTTKYNELSQILQLQAKIGPEE